MRRLYIVIAGLAFFAASSLTAAAAPRVVASIKPVQSLVAAVMGELGSPSLIVDGSGSPHTWSLKPSQAAMLEDADMIVWIGPELETFLEKPIDTLGTGAQVLTLGEIDGLVLLDTREGGTFEAHDHDHGHDDDHAHDDAHSHEGEHGHDDDHHDSASHDEHGHGKHDPHVWLDPENAKAFVRAIAAALVAADPAHGETYQANAQALVLQLETLMTDVREMMAPITDTRFVVFHDAYQYFENRFDMSAAGSITVTPDVMPGAERVDEIRQTLLEFEAVCVFSEPQFQARLIDVVTEGTQARSGTLDPLGADIPAGPDHYEATIRQLAESFRTCLQAAD